MPVSGAPRKTPLPPPWWPQHGAKNAGGASRIRAANTTTGRFSAEGMAVERWRRAYVRNGYRSIRALGQGTINGMDAQGYLRMQLAREEADGIAPALIEATYRGQHWRVPEHRDRVNFALPPTGVAYENLSRMS